MGCLWRGFLLTLGLIFLAVGVWMALFESRRVAAEGELVAGLRAVTAGGLEDRAPGAETLVEGRLSERNRVAFRDYVAYVREEYRGEDDDGDDIWREDERVTPRLLVEAGGIVELSNEDYVMEGALTRWREEGPLRYSSLAGEGSKRYYGIAAGSTVTALGQAEPGPEGNRLRARILFVGTQADLIASRRSEAAALPWFGALFGVIGLVVIGVGVFLRR